MAEPASAEVKEEEAVGNTDDCHVASAPAWETPDSQAVAEAKAKLREAVPGGPPSLVQRDGPAIAPTETEMLEAAAKREFGASLKELQDTYGLSEKEAVMMVKQRPQAQAWASLMTDDEKKEIKRLAGGPTLAKGDRVEIHSLSSRPELNGKYGLVASYDAAKARYAVQLASRERVLLKQANLTHRPPPEPNDGSAFSFTFPKPEPASAPSEVIDALFVAATSFEGRREGFVYKMGDAGLGYYKDVAPEPALPVATDEQASMMTSRRQTVVIAVVCAVGVLLAIVAERLLRRVANDDDADAGTD